jgi:hypothetical protein
MAQLRFQRQEQIPRGIANSKLNKVVAQDTSLPAQSGSESLETQPTNVVDHHDEDCNPMLNKVFRSDFGMPVFSSTVMR